MADEYKIDRWGGWSTGRLANYSRFLVHTGGAIAIAQTATAPLERVKVLLQLQPILKPLQGEAALGGTVGAISRLISQFGFTSLWQGNMAHIWKNIATASVQYGCFLRVKRKMMPLGESNYYGPEAVLRKVGAASLSGFWALLLTYPLEVARLKMTVNLIPASEVKLYPSTKKALQVAMGQSGFASLYKGLLLSMGITVPYSTISILIYDYFKENPISSQTIPDPFKLYVAPAFLAGLVAQTFCYPLDTLRKRYLISGDLMAGKMYTSTRQTFNDCYFNEGLRALYRGFTISTIRFFPIVLAQFYAFDQLGMAIEMGKAALQKQ